MKKFKPQVRTKNFSAAPLRGSLGEFPMRAIVRLGSRTSVEDAYPRKSVGRPVIEINPVESIENSRDKLRMKACFAEAEIPQADWWTLIPGGANHFNKYNYQDENGGEITSIENLPYPIIAKRICGFKGHGMYKLDTQEQFEDWLRTNNTNSYYFESYFSGSAEFRLHVTHNGCFMAWRKLRKADTPDDRRWYFNSDHCNWVGEEHELFNKPSNWDQMIDDSVKALKSTGLDIGCVDLRCQSPKKRDPKYIIVEVNSAPSLGDRGVEVYREVLQDLISHKIENS